MYFNQYILPFIESKMDNQRSSILDQGFMRQMLNTKIDTKCQFLYSLNPQIANLNYQFVDSIRWQVG